MDNYLDTVQTIERILIRERGYIFKVPRGGDVVFLASGGLDSVVSMDKVIQEWDVNLYPLFIKRGARAEKFEEQAFDYFVGFYTKKYPKNFNPPYKIKTEIPPVEFKPYFSAKMLKKIGYPMRDASLQNVGIQYAVSLNERYHINIRTVFTAMSPDEHFPHCSILALRAQNLLACIDTDRWDWQITSPLTEPTLGEPLFKKDLILWAMRYNIPLEKTRTCISERRRPDGTCLECLWRLNSFKEAGIKDPLKYKN